MFTPKNEQGVIVLFSQQCVSAGWEFVEVGAAFPDAILRHDGKLWRVEFEYHASNFVYHKHDCRDCDLIICWENDYVDSVLPIIEISNEQWPSIPLFKPSQLQVEVHYWKTNEQYHRARQATI